MSKVILFGCGRGAEVAYRHLKRDTGHEVIGFTVDEAFLKSDTFQGLPVVPFEEVEKKFPPSEHKMFTLLGYQNMNQFRASKYLQGKKKGYQFISYVNSTAYSLEELDIGENCFIMENQSINLDVKVGNNVVMWSCNQIGDCTVIEDHVWISSHVTVADHVRIKEYSFIGINVGISNNVTIAPNTFIGGGLFVAQDTKKGSVYALPTAKLIAEDSSAFMRVLEATKKL
jgi:sugar O-acyltransferase (sialic acid O-acetyltransferase NeuD family)